MIAVAIGLAAWLWRRPAPVHFQRVPFSIVSGEPLRYDGSLLHWRCAKERISVGQGIADGQGVTFRKDADLQASPGRAGEFIVFFSYAIKPLPNKSIRVAVVQRRQDREKTLRAFTVNKKSNGYFSAVVTLKRGETIHVHATGHGHLIAGRAIFAAIMPPQSRQYVFVVAPDTFRGDRIGRRGLAAGRTPHIEAFGRDAVTFENNIAPSSWTLPSFASFFSGQFEFHHRVAHDSPIPGDAPHLLAGIAPRFAVVQFNDGAWMSARLGFARHHDCFLTSSRTSDIYADRRLFANARTFLEASPLPALFMFLHTYKLHSPYEPGEEFRAALGPDPSSRRMNTFTKQAQFNSKVPEVERRTLVRLYDAEVRQFDHFFGEFIRHLKLAGIYKRSLIVLTSDHGEEFGEHGGWFHGHSLYREIHHVPLLIKFPGELYAGRRCREFVSLCDVLPTVLDHLKIDCPPGIDGISLLPLIQGSPPPTRTIFSSAAASQFNKHLPQRFSMFSGSHHLIFNFPMPLEAPSFYHEYGQPPARPQIELYDVRADPGERREISSERKRVVDSLRPEIARVLKEICRGRKAGGKAGSLLAEEKNLLRSLGYL